MFCKKCGAENLNYNNYCLNDGENLDNISLDLNIQTNSSNYCGKCGQNKIGSENYCINCGEMTDVISKKKQSYKINTNDNFGNVLNVLKEKNGLQFGLKNLSLDSFKRVDKKGIMLSVVFTLILSSILVAINLMSLTPSDISNENLQYIYSEMGTSKLKIFLCNLVTLNSPSIKMALNASLLNVSLINAFNITFKVAQVIQPLIIGLFVYISVRLGLKSDNIEDDTLANAISYASLYSVIMVIFGIIGSFSLYEDGVTLKIGMSLFNLFINSFIISFISSYIGISKDRNHNIVAEYLNKSLKHILIGISIMTAIIVAFIAVEINETIYIKEMINYYSDESKFIAIILAILILPIIGAWLFTLSNFVTISVFGITSYNIISLAKVTNFAILFLMIIPIGILVLMGRKIKSTYGENQVTKVILYSTTYSILMFVLSYFNRIALSLNSGQIQEYLTEIIDEIVYQYAYMYSDIVNNYLQGIFNNLNSGIYMGSNLFLTIIITFIFSFIFVMLGYKTKKIDTV